MDETGIQLEHKLGKVIAKKGSKYLQSSTSGNRETITVICAVNAVGSAVPHYLIVKKISKRSFQTLIAPEGSMWSVSDTGWIK